MTPLEMTFFGTNSTGADLLWVDLFWGRPSVGMTSFRRNFSRNDLLKNISHKEFGVFLSGHCAVKFLVSLFARLSAMGDRREMFCS